MGSQSDEDWSSWPVTVHNKAGVGRSLLDIDEEQEEGHQPKLACLPRFLAHPAQVVRMEAAQMWLAQPDLRGSALRVLPLVFDDLLLRDVNHSWTQEDLEQRTR
jgi:hypothetical protein